METSETVKGIIDKPGFLKLGELLAGSYHVCDTCKEAIFEYSGPTCVTMKNFIAHHSKLCGGLKMINGTEFLSKYLTDGYIDVDRPAMEPVSTRLGPPEELETPSKFGAEAALEIQKRMRRAGTTPRPGPVVRAPEEPDLLRSSRSLLVSIKQELIGVEILKRDLELVEYALLQYISHCEGKKKEEEAQEAVSE